MMLCGEILWYIRKRGTGVTMELKLSGIADKNSLPIFSKFIQTRRRHLQYLGGE